MKILTKSILAVAFAAAFLAGAVRAEVEIGKSAPDFTLTDLNGKTHKLSDYKGKTVVLEWVNAECPFVVKHYSSGNIPSLQKSATSDGVVWLLINSGHPGAQGDYDAPKVNSWMKENGVAASAYFRDQDGKVGRLFGAKTSPHLYVIKGDGTLVYNGAIDSIRSPDKADIAKATNYVSEALAAVKAGKPVATSTSQPYGCSVKY
ncbi:MAG TPA: redoxin domain-containing protein [Opitutaceae bacterium]|nr:redoxin domain-containing protein [Opitutaceae bacterium]